MLDRVHGALAPILKTEQQRRDKAAESRSHWDEPKFDSAVGQRRWRLFNAVLMELSRRGHNVSAYEREGLIGDTRVDLDIIIAGTHRKARMHGRDWPARDLPVSTPLALVTGGDRDRPGGTFWRRRPASSSQAAGDHHAPDRCRRGQVLAGG
jgi:hypothetical protein